MTYSTPNEFVKEWVDVFTSDYSYKNPLYGRGALHVALGRCLINQRIKKRGSYTSPRVSMFYLQGPSSGKSSGYSMIHEVIDSLNIEIDSPDEMTDAALIGTVERTMDENGDETWEVEEGILSEVEVFHLDEASVLINPKDYQQNMMTYLQKALNPIGSEQNKITKSLAHGDEIVVRPNCSLILTSYMPEGIEDTVLNTGFLQRMLVFPRDLTIEDRIDQTELDIQALGEDRKESNLQDLINELKRIRNHYKEPMEFSWDKAKPTFVKYQRDMYDEIRDTPIEVRSVLEGFIPRMLEQLTRLAFHYCCMRRDTEIQPRDVRNAAPLMMTSLHMIIYWLEENPQLRGGNENTSDATSRFRGFLKVVEESDPVSGEYYGMRDLLDGLEKVWNLSETSCYRWINVFDDKGWISVREKSNTKYVKVTQ
ncbi:MAG: hypothetical protein ABEH81_01205 [Halopenitus sp.]